MRWVEGFGMDKGEQNVLVERIFRPLVQIAVRSMLKSLRLPTVVPPLGRSGGRSARRRYKRRISRAIKRAMVQPRI